MLRRTVIALVMAFFCAAALMPAQAEAAGKIGVANPMRLSNQSNPGKEAEKQLTDMFGKEREQLEKQGAALNKQAEDLRKQAAALSEKARNAFMIRFCKTSDKGATAAAISLAT